MGIEPNAPPQDCEGLRTQTHSFSFAGFWRSAAEPISSFIHTRELRLRIVLVNLLMIPRDYSCCTSSLARICGSMNLAMSAQLFVGGLAAVAPETGAFFDAECRSCAICESCKALICKVLR